MSPDSTSPDDNMEPDGGIMTDKQVRDFQRQDAADQAAKFPNAAPGGANTDHPYGDGTHGTAAGAPLDRLGAGRQYRE